MTHLRVHAHPPLSNSTSLTTAASHAAKDDISVGLVVSWRPLGLGCLLPGLGRLQPVSQGIPVPGHQARGLAGRLGHTACIASAGFPRAVLPPGSSLAISAYSGYNQNSHRPEPSPRTSAAVGRTSGQAAPRKLAQLGGTHVCTQPGTKDGKAEMGARLPQIPGTALSANF